MFALSSIDTLQFSKRMQKAGLKGEVADEIAETFKEITVQSMENISTKQDIVSLRQEMKQDIASFRQETKQEFALVRHEMNQEFVLVRQEMKSLHQEMKQEFALVRQEFNQENITIKQEFALVRQEMKVLYKDAIIKMGSLTIFTGIITAGFLAWFLPIAIR